MKKIISAILSICLLFSVTTTAFAADISNQKVASIVENGIEYITLYDKENHTVQAIHKNIATGESVYGPVISTITSTDINNDNKIALAATKIHQDTFINFEYDIWLTTPNEWRLERPNGVFSQNYFMVYENTSNSSQLYTWKDDVDELNSQEFVVIGAVGLSAWEIIKASVISHAAVTTGGALTTAAVKSIIQAVGATGAAALAITALGEDYNNCRLSYKAVFDNTNNIHY